MLAQLAGVIRELVAILCRSRGQPMDIPWTTYGHPVDNLWTSWGQFVDNLLTTCGHPVDNLWKPCGHPVDNLWTSCGQPMDILWTTCGHPVDNLWTSWGQFVNIFPNTIIWHFRRRQKKLHNEKFHDLYSSINIIRVTKSRMMRRTGHMARMGDKRYTYRY